MHEEAGKFSLGGQGAGDAVESGEVGVIESVSAFDGCLAHPAKFHGPSLPVTLISPGGSGLVMATW